LIRIIGTEVTAINRSPDRAVFLRTQVLNR
jgi:hypothetical protein